MPQIRFTDRTIAALPKPDKGQVDYFCKGEPGFAIRVSLGGTKSWFCKYLFKGTQYRLPLGRYPSVTLAAARALARDVK
ncbi:MAG: Arm DNA-binding domain-containing protein, partial [Alphaproteobacteria bacterium]|nr:Arm DNA-binding domain-containing protein [Alphaproteobacteria bacterium]